MNIVVISDDQNVDYAEDTVQLDVFPDNEPEIYVVPVGTPGPRGLQGDPGPKGDTGSIGDVDALPPLYYSPSQNTIYMDTSYFDIAGAAAAALQTAKNYADSILATKPSKYVHNQFTPASSWYITHNLNTKPDVTITDSANNTIIGDIYYDNLNSLHVNFSVLTSGTAYLI